jgi:hypothetical protein
MDLHLIFAPAVVDAYYKEVGFGLNTQLKTQGHSFH